MNPIGIGNSESFLSFVERESVSAKLVSESITVLVEDAVCLYTFETDLSDGWENSEVHNDSENKRLQALKMGANILMYAFMM